MVFLRDRMGCRLGHEALTAVQGNHPVALRRMADLFPASQPAEACHVQVGNLKTEKLDQGTKCVSLQHVICACSKCPSSRPAKQRASHTSQGFLPGT